MRDEGAAVVVMGLLESSDEAEDHSSWTTTSSPSSISPNTPVFFQKPSRETAAAAAAAAAAARTEPSDEPYDDDVDAELDRNTSDGLEPLPSASDADGMLFGGLMLDEDSDEETKGLDSFRQDSFRKEESSWESRVVLGSDHLLHHRRLPSTIYEEGSSSSFHVSLNNNTESNNTMMRMAGTGTAKGLSSLPTSPVKLGDIHMPRRSASMDNLLQEHLHHHHRHDVPHPTKMFGHAIPDTNTHKNQQHFTPIYRTSLWLQQVSMRVLKRHYSPMAAATWVGFWALLIVTCANYVLTPLRDAIALQVGVEHMPLLTLVSTVLAFGSSVPIGWLFEAPDPTRRKLWKRMGLTRGETQGSSLALFYRCFALTLLSYAIAFQFVEHVAGDDTTTTAAGASLLWSHVLWIRLGKGLYVAFFLVVHLMKLHSLSLVWGVTTEAMEYEEVARKKSEMESNKTRLQRLALVGFGGTVGGILGSGLASSMAHVLRLPGLLVLASLLLEVSAELSIELGRIMQKHWEEQQLFQSSNDLASLDTSMKRSASVGSMKRVASGNSLNRVKSATDLSNKSSAKAAKCTEPVNDNTFTQRLLRGVTTILRSRLLMAIFTYNALYASTTVLLSFQRAALVASRNGNTTAEADTAFLANINMASSVAIFALQASGLGAYLANACGPRGTLALMPLIRLLGVLSLAWWHRFSSGRPPNLLIFLVVDECCKIMNLAVAKPVRESLWRGLSNEARYEAKPIVDTLANRWGGGSAAFLVSFLNRTLNLFGVQPDTEGVRNVFGFPPILFLCMLIATWWTVVSADLGHIRRRIDLELKKRE